MMGEREGNHTTEFHIPSLGEEKRADQSFLAF